MESRQTTTPDPKPTDNSTTILNRKAEPDKPKAEGEGDDKPKPGEGAPETYTDYTMPEGFTLDPAVKTRADALFKSLNLTQDGAQKAVDLYRELATEAFQQPFNAYREMVADWLTESEAHPDLRGKLGPGEEINVRIGKFLDGLPDQALAKDFRYLMDLTGAGNHQAFIRVVNHVAKQLTEGAHVTGNGPAKAGQSEPGKAPPSVAAALWPNLKPATDG